MDKKISGREIKNSAKVVGSVEAKELSDTEIDHQSQTLLGRLKLKLFRSISGKTNTLPSSIDIQHYILSKHRRSGIAARITSSIITLTDFYDETWSEIRESLDLHEVTSVLREDPLEKQLFVELRDCPRGIIPANLGVLVRRVRLRNDDFAYDVYFLGEEKFPDYICGHAMIDPGRDDSQLLFSDLQQDGKYKNYDLDSYSASWQVVLALSVLRILAKKRHGYLVKLEDFSHLADIEEGPRAKADAEFDRLCFAVYQDKISCTRMKVPFSVVRPFDIDHCLDYSLDVIKVYAASIERGVQSELAVYWNGQCFIMNDDYAPYLAYRSLNAEEASVVVMGVVPKGIGRVIATGGQELMPPIGLIRISDNTPTAPKPLPTKAQLLDERLRIVREELTTDSDKRSLFALFVRLASLVRNPYTKEKELHRFILECPAVFDAYGFGIMSEVRLKKKYRVDLIIQYGYNDKRILLVELERATHKIFTTKGRPQAYVTHAMQQIEDALRWWRENPNDIPKELDASLPVEGLVVIGRSIDMRDEAKRRLLHLNYNRHVKIITYDDLLDRIENLMRSLEDIRV